MWSAISIAEGRRVAPRLATWPASSGRTRWLYLDYAGYPRTFIFSPVARLML